jgi:hypothetical protein
MRRPTRMGTKISRTAVTRIRHGTPLSHRRVSWDVPIRTSGSQLLGANCRLKADAQRWSPAMGCFRLPRRQNGFFGSVVVSLPESHGFPLRPNSRFDPGTLAKVRQRLDVYALSAPQQLLLHSWLFVNFLSLDNSPHGKGVSKVGGKSRPLLACPAGTQDSPAKRNDRPPFSCVSLRPLTVRPAGTQDSCYTTGKVSFV